MVTQVHSIIKFQNCYKLLELGTACHNVSLLFLELSIYSIRGSYFISHKPEKFPIHLLC